MSNYMYYVTVVNNQRYGVLPNDRTGIKVMLDTPNGVSSSFPDGKLWVMDGKERVKKYSAIGYTDETVEVDKFKTCIQLEAQIFKTEHKAIGYLQDSGFSMEDAIHYIANLSYLNSKG